MARSGVFGLCGLWLVAAAVAVKVKMVMHSEQEDSRVEEEEAGVATTRPELWERHARPDVTMMPFLKRHDKPTVATVEQTEPLHPNDMLFPLIYKQTHINSMFKFGENWYTWSTDKRPDGSRALNYYICYDEPKHCDEVGWERTDSVPKCAFEIDSVVQDDRACLNTFGVEPRGGSTSATICDGADQMKVTDVVRACGPRIRSLWRFVRVGRRSPSAAKPADVNSLLCEDEEECFLTVEYRIHHDRITFSLHEPTRGQTYKSVLKRDQPAPATVLVEETTEMRKRRRGAGGSRGVRGGGRGGAAGRHDHLHDADDPRTMFRPRVKTEGAEGKGVQKERELNDSGYNARRAVINKIKIREDVSEDFSVESP